MSLSERDRQTFGQIVRALANDALVMMACIDKRTGEPVTCLCAAIAKTGIVPRTPADVQFVPLARLFQGNPADELVIPGFDAEAAGEKGSN